MRWRIIISMPTEKRLLQGVNKEDRPPFVEVALRYWDRPLGRILPKPRMRR